MARAIEQPAREFGVLRDEISAICSEGDGLRMILAAHAVTSSVLKRVPDMPAKRAAYLVWSGMVTLTITAEEAGYEFPLPTDLSDEEEANLFQRLRNILTDMRDSFALGEHPNRREYVTVAQAMLDVDNDCLWSLVGRLPRDTIGEVFGPRAEAEDHLPVVTGEDAAAVCSKIEQGEARIQEIRPRVAAAGERLNSAMTDLEEGLRGAIDALPDTGELHGLRSFALSYLETIEVNEALLDPAVNGRHPLFRRVALNLGLRDVSWTHGEREAGVALVEHPAKFNRYNPSDRGAIDGKRRLRAVRECFSGPDQPTERASVVSTLRNPSATPEEILVVLSDYCSAKLERAPSFDALAAVHQGLVDALLYSFFTDPVSLVGLLFSFSPYSGNARLRTRLDEEIEQLASAESACEAQSLPSLPYFKAPARTVVEVAPQVAREMVKLSYLVNPESRTPRTITQVVAKDEAIEAIAALIEAHGDATVPADSLARAVFHYAFDVPEEHRTLWNKESCGTFVFHKIKRGTSRLYVRVDGNEVTFHAYARRDWVKPKRFAK